MIRLAKLLGVIGRQRQCRNFKHTSEKSNNIRFGELATSLEASSKHNRKVLAMTKQKSFEDLEDHDGETEHFRKISDTSRPYPRDFQSKIEDLLGEK